MFILAALCEEKFKGIQVINFALHLPVSSLCYTLNVWKMEYTICYTKNNIIAMMF